MFYTYYSYEEWGRGYIGYSRYDGDPLKHQYFGSFKDKTFSPTNKIILGVYETKSDAIAAEIVLHDYFEVDVNPHFANRRKQGSTKWTNPGAWTEKRRKKQSERMKGVKKGPMPPETRQKIRQTRLERGCGVGNTNARGNRYSLTDEQKDNRRAAALRRLRIPCPVCGRICVGNAGLTLHQKAHNKRSC